MSRKPEMMRNPEVECHQYDPWRDLALEAELDAMIADVVRRQKEASARCSAVATGTSPLPNLRPTPTASSPAALPVERAAEYVHSDPNQQLEAEAAVSAAPARAGGLGIRPGIRPDPQQFVKLPMNALECRRHRRDAAVLEALEQLGMGTGGNGKYTLVELGIHLNCPMTCRQNLCAHLASMSFRGLIHHESGTGLYCSMADPHMPAVAVETQEVAPNASELLESPTAVEAPASPAVAPDAPTEPAASSEPVSVIETNDNNRARRDRILTKAFDHMGRGQIGNNTYTLMDFSNHLDMKTNLWDVRMHLHDMILRGLVRLVGPGVYAAVPECLRPPVPQDAYEHEEV